MQPIQRPMPFVFKGSGADYFKIWLVNTALIIATLGIYYPWAKVRRNQYFYRNTFFDHSSFDYHAKPKDILRGWLLALVFYLSIGALSVFSPQLGIGLLIPIFFVTPWVLRATLRFRAKMSSYRGVRFQFVGRLADAYKVFLLLPLLAILTFNMMGPFALHRAQAYLVSNLRYGDAPFAFRAKAKDYYKIYFKLAVGFLGIGIFMVLLSAVFLWVTQGGFGPTAILGVLALVVYITLSLALLPWLRSRLHNVAWGQTQLAQDKMFSSQRARGLAKLYAGNALGMVLTLGLFYPFMQVRNTRYRLQHMGFVTQSTLDNVVHNQSSEANALGQEFAGLFDMDISL